MRKRTVFKGLAIVIFPLVILVLIIYFSIAINERKAIKLNPIIEKERKIKKLKKREVNIKESKEIEMRRKVFNAIKLNDIELLKECINNGYDINNREEGYSIIIYKGEEKYIIEKPAFTSEDVEKIGEEFSNKGYKFLDKKSNYTALMYAVNNRNYNIINLLISKGADVNISSELFSSLSIALINSDIELLKYLVENGADLNSKKNIRLPIFFAIQGGNIDAVNYLLEKGADIESKALDCEDDTALIYAASLGDYEICKLLLEKGANINSINKKSENALLSLLINGDFVNNKDKLIDTIKLLINKKIEIGTNEERALHYALETRNREVITLISEMTNGSKDNNIELIRLMMLNKWKEAEKRITETSSNYIFKPYNGKNAITPMILGIESNNRIIIEKLIRAKADINLIMGVETPVIVAAKNNNFEMVKYLCENGADLKFNSIGSESEPFDTYYTAAYYAIKNNNLEMVKYLVEKGVHVDSVISSDVHDDGENYTLLMFAVSIQNIEIVKYLLKKGAEINYSTHWGNSALREAVKNENIQLVKILLECKADVNEGGWEGNIMQEAEAKGNYEIIKLLKEFQEKNRQIKKED